MGREGRVIKVEDERTGRGEGGDRGNTLWDVLVATGGN